MLTHRKANARLQSDFYRNQFRRWLHLSLVAVVILIVLLSILAYLIFFSPQNTYYANSVDGKLWRMPQPQ